MESPILVAQGIGRSDAPLRECRYVKEGVTLRFNHTACGSDGHAHSLHQPRWADTTLRVCAPSPGVHVHPTFVGSRVGRRTRTGVLEGQHIGRTNTHVTDVSGPHWKTLRAKLRRNNDLTWTA